MLISSVLGSPAAQAQGEGARAFELSPAGSRLLSVYGEFARGNASFDPGSVTPGTHIEVDGGIFDYSHSVGLRGHAVILDVALPVVTLSLCRSAVSSASSELPPCRRRNMKATGRALRSAC